MKKPSRTPAKISSRCSTRNTCGRNTDMQNPASVKRSARKTNTDESSSEFLTTTNVDPHSSVQNASANSARKRLGCSFVVKTVGTVRQAYQRMATTKCLAWKATLHGPLTLPQAQVSCRNNAQPAQARASQAQPRVRDVHWSNRHNQRGASRKLDRDKISALHNLF